MRLAIVDDEEVFRLKLADSIFSLYGKENASCFLYSDGTEIVKSFENGFIPDAVFLDIEMKDLDGMKAAKKIREFSKDIPVIFLTSHTEMAMEGYEVDAFRFLSKPVEPDKLRQALKDLEKTLTVDEKLILHKDGEDLIFPISTLVYAEAANNSVRFVFEKEDTELRMKFTQAVKMIDEVSKDFYKCHRSYYVNLSHVAKLGSGELITDTGDCIPVARSSAQDTKKALFDFVRRSGR